jgi:hypothetical protein
MMKGEIFNPSQVDPVCWNFEYQFFHWTKPNARKRMSQSFHQQFFSLTLELALKIVCFPVTDNIFYETFWLELTVI